MWYLVNKDSKGICKNYLYYLGVCVKEDVEVNVIGIILMIVKS